MATALHGTTAQVAGGDARGPVEFLEAATARTRLVSMGGTSLLVAVLVVVSLCSSTTVNSPCSAPSPPHPGRSVPRPGCRSVACCTARE
ncbi:hypothetical protein [Streptomyces sp. MMG1121]|uniref:hypothetical protein n=1 Tax=Streptomyces sp. MMG1121 TaxID=1415544 RepID=UPI003B63AF0F